MTPYAPLPMGLIGRVAGLNLEHVAARIASAGHARSISIRRGSPARRDAKTEGDRARDGSGDEENVVSDGEPPRWGTRGRRGRYRLEGVDAGRRARARVDGPSLAVRPSCRLPSSSCADLRRDGIDCSGSPAISSHPRERARRVTSGFDPCGGAIAAPRAETRPCRTRRGGARATRRPVRAAAPTGDRPASVESSADHRATLRRRALHHVESVAKTVGHFRNRVARCDAPTSTRTSLDVLERDADERDVPRTSYSLFLATHIPATIMMDSQALVPAVVVPGSRGRCCEFHVRTNHDHAHGVPAGLVQVVHPRSSSCSSSVLLRGCPRVLRAPNWIRVPGSRTARTRRRRGVPILAEIRTHERVPLRGGGWQLFLIYLPYLVIPAMMALVLCFDEKPFGEDGDGPVRGARERRSESRADGRARDDDDARRREPADLSMTAPNSRRLCDKTPRARTSTAPTAPSLFALPHRRAAILDPRSSLSGSSVYERAAERALIPERERAPGRGSSSASSPRAGIGSLHRRRALGRPHVRRVPSRTLDEPRRVRGVPLGTPGRVASAPRRRTARYSPCPRSTPRATSAAAHVATLRVVGDQRCARRPEPSGAPSPPRPAPRAVEVDREETRKWPNDVPRARALERFLAPGGDRALVRPSPSRRRRPTVLAVQRVSHHSPARWSTRSAALEPERTLSFRPPLASPSVKPSDPSAPPSPRTPPPSRARRPGRRAPGPANARHETWFSTLAPRRDRPRRAERSPGDHASVFTPASRAFASFGRMAWSSARPARTGTPRGWSRRARRWTCCRRPRRGSARTSDAS